jgi:uncharacterized membrane protein YecN with MAPEG domain
MTSEQKAVTRGASAALLVTLFALWLGWNGYDSFTRTTGFGGETAQLVAIQCALCAPALMLMIAIARVASQRFSSEADIGGEAFTQASPRLRLLRALLTNTLEQSVLAFIVYILLAEVAPANAFLLTPTMALLFVMGRILFFAFYAKGAGARAFGFGLTFYPTVLGLLLAAWLLASKIAANWH